MRRFLPVVLLVCTVAAGFQQQDSSALINKALDELFNLKVDNTVPAAMAAITRETGVRLQEDPAIWDLLPWGKDTKIQTDIRNITLREALTAITRKLGLALVLRDNYIEIQPMPALRRLAQRASWDELATLDYLASQPIGLDTDRPTIKQLLEFIDTRLASEKKLNIAIENRSSDVAPANKTVFVPRNATLLEALESLPKDTKATWYPWGKNIMIVSKEDRTRRLLSKPLTIIRPGERGIDVLELLREVSSRTGVSFEYQPGVVQTLPPELRTIRVTIDNIPAQDILENVAAATGLSYTIEDEKVIITSAGPRAAATARDPVIGILQLDNGMQVLVPTSQVPPDLREYLKHKTQLELEKIRAMMEEEGFKPSTPATQPASKATGEDRDL